MSQVYTYVMENQEQGPVRVVNLSEADIRRVSTEIEATPETVKAELPSREVVRQALVSVLPQPAPAITPTTSPQPDIDPASANAAARVDALVQMAVTDGIDAAASAAAGDEPFVIDALHDALTGALHDELQRRGQL